MLTRNENRFQYVYFILSAIVACVILVLTYFTVKLSADERLRNDLRVEQKAFNLIKPSSNWNYNNTWRFIGNPAQRHQIYSAYFDVRQDVIDDLSDSENLFPVGSFRIFAILPTKFSDVVSCVIRYDDYTLKEIKAEVARPIPEHHDNPFAAFTIMCPMRVLRKEGNNVKLPKSIAIAYASNRLSHTNPTFVPISYPRDMEQVLKRSKPAISVCIGPLQGPYTDVIRIVEFIEIYRILGASHFYFYNFNASEDVLRLLHHYRDLGIADLFTWNVEEHIRDIHYAGIVGQINDCVYRANVVDNYRYAAVVDLDEVIMPLKHNSLSEYLRQCDEGRTSAFIFRNVFFYKKDSADIFSAPGHVKNRMLYTQTKVRRTLEILPANTRTKCVVNTRAIVEMGNHFVWRNAPGYADAVVHQNVGLLFHYRDKCIDCKAVLITDYTVRRFGSLIWDRVDETCLKVYTELEGICPRD